MVSESKKEKWMTCEVCDDRFDSLRALACHKRNTGHGEYDKFTIRICQHCDSEFRVKKADLLSKKAAKYCSKECRIESKKNQVTVTCKFCEEEFVVVESKKKRKYCSRSCMYKDPCTKERLKRQGKEVGKKSPDGEAIEKRLDTIQEKYEKEEIVSWCRKGARTGEVWNKGLTKETDERVRKHAEQLVGHDPHRGSGWGKGGYREDIDHFVRSTWEADVARVFQYFGWKYEYEPDSFDIDSGTYRPDFYLPKFRWYIEISGYVTENKKYKLKKFKEKYGLIQHITKKGYAILHEKFADDLRFEGKMP